MRSLITIILAAIALTSGTTSHAAQRADAQPNQPIVVPIFTERQVQVLRPRDYLSGRVTSVDKVVPVVAFGTGFLYDVPDTKALITAAHVVEFPPDLKSISDAQGVYSIEDGYTLQRQRARIRIGGLSLQPKRILVDHKLDIAVLELDEQTAKTLGLRALRAGKAVVDREAKTWGFPGIPGVLIDGEASASTPSASQTSQRCDVTDVRRGEVICTALNGIETRGGFSGGPLIDSQGEVIGMISRSTPETTRCRSVEAIDSVIARFPAEARLYLD